MVVLNENLMGNMARMKKFIDNLSVRIMTRIENTVIGH